MADSTPNGLGDQARIAIKAKIKPVTSVWNSKRLLDFFLISQEFLDTLAAFHPDEMRSAILET